MANVANQITFVDKQPNGYSYADFMDGKCFLTLNHLNSLESFVAISRNGNEEPTIYFVSKKYLDDAITLLGVSMPASTEISVTDDFLSMAIFKVVDQVSGKVDAGRTNSSYLTARIVNTKQYSAGILVEGSQYNLAEVASTTRGFVLAKDHFGVLKGLIDSPPVEELQLVEFDAIPDAGAFSLTIGESSTAPVAFNEGAAELQLAIQAIAGYETASVMGDYTAGFTLNLGFGNTAQATVNTNTLTAVAVPVVITISTTQEGN